MQAGAGERSGGDVHLSGSVARTRASRRDTGVPELMCHHGFRCFMRRCRKEGVPSRGAGKRGKKKAPVLGWRLFDSCGRRSGCVRRGEDLRVCHPSGADHKTTEKPHVNELPAHAVKILKMEGRVAVTPAGLSMRGCLWSSARAGAAAMPAGGGGRCANLCVF